MNESDLISIIIPCYNIENLVASTVKTICNQTYRNLEIILVNDGSKDGTAKVLDQLALSDNRIKVIHKENGGVTSARLEGVRAATGAWIGFVDGDDAIEPDMYEHLLKNAHTYHADISHCGYQMVFPRRVDYYYNTGRLVEQDKITGLKDLLSGEFIEPGLCNKLFHKILFHSLLHNDLMDLSITNNEDLLMNYYLFREANKSVYEDFCPYHYMVRGNSAATGKVSHNKIAGPWRVCTIIREAEAENDLLRQTINSRLVSHLINVATMDVDKNHTEILDLCRNARLELRTMLPELIHGRYSRRTKVLSVWAYFSPATYRLAHAFYAKIRGTDKKYEVS